MTTSAFVVGGGRQPLRGRPRSRYRVVRIDARERSLRIDGRSRAVARLETAVDVATFAVRLLEIL